MCNFMSIIFTMHKLVCEQVWFLLSGSQMYNETCVLRGPTSHVLVVKVLLFYQVYLGSVIDVYINSQGVCSIRIFQ